MFFALVKCFNLYTTLFIVWVSYHLSCDYARFKDLLLLYHDLYTQKFDCKYVQNLLSVTAYWFSRIQAILYFILGFITILLQHITVVHYTIDYIWYTILLHQWVAFFYSSVAAILKIKTCCLLLADFSLVILAVNICKIQSLHVGYSRNRMGHLFQTVLLYIPHDGLLGFLCFYVMLVKIKQILHFNQCILLFLTM